MSQMTQMIPTVVIGLGTFGGQVASFLRTLVYEELGTPGLPIFRFIQISTHKNEEPQVLVWPPNQDGNRPWEMLEIIKAVIPAGGPDRLRGLMDPSNPISRQSPGWREWFDPALLGQPDTVLSENGAGSVRMVGRACLWYNWNREASIREKLVNALQNVISQKVEANDLLKKYHERKTGSTPPQGYDFVANVSKARVYLVGSLCGGSASGMFLDLAYFFKRQGNDKIFGIFSVPDAEAANSVDEGRIGANAFAALKELDFYTHANTPYSAHFPGESSRIESTEPPFAFVRLASPSGYDYRLGQEGVTTARTVEELAKVCAASMFFEVLGGNQSLLETMHKDYAAKVDLWGQPSEVPPHYAKALSSFGAGTAHYPKYRIAGAAACKLLEGQVLAWAGKKLEINPDTLEQTTVESRVDEGKIAALAQKWLQKALAASQGELTYGTRGRGKGSLEDEFNAEFRNVFMPGGKPRQANAVQLEQELTSLPQEKPFSQRFVRDGHYVRLLLSRLPDYKNALAKNLQQAFDDAIDKIMAQDNIFTEDAQLNDLGELQALYKYMCEEFLGQRISKARGFSVAQVDTGFMKGFFREFIQAESSLASWTLGLTGPTQNYYRTKAVSVYRQALNREFAKMLEAMEAEALKELPKDLERLVGSRLYRLMDKSRDSLNILAMQYAKLVQTDDFANLITVVTDSAKGLAFDVQRLAEKFDRTSWPQVYKEVSQNDPGNRQVKSLLMDPETDSRKAVNQITDVLVRRIMSSMDMSNFDIVDLLLKNYSVSFAHTARRTKPLVQLLATQHEILSQKKSPRLVCGGQEGSQERLLAFFKKSDVSEFENFSQDTAMQHMLHLYQEVAGFALNEMTTCKALEDFYLANLDSRDVVKRVLHTDIMPSRFDIGRYKRVSDLTHEYGSGRPSLMRLVGDFLNERFFTRRPLNETDDEIVFEWKEAGISQDALYDPDDRMKFAWNLAGSEEGVRQFKQKALDLMGSLSQEDMIGLAESLKQRILAKHGRGSQEEEEYKRIFNADFIAKKFLPWWR